jgi:hypothetical protein
MDNIINDPLTQQADQTLFVQFFTRPQEQTFESEKQGRPIYKDCVYIRIQAPGDSLNIVERPMWEQDKARFPRQWLAFQAQEQQSVEGTPVQEWASIGASQAQELKAMGFHTVEQLANASDTQLQKIGMGGFGLRAKAQAWLASANDGALVQQQAAELERQKAEIEALKKQIEGIAQEKRGPGRPRKEEAA